MTTKTNPLLKAITSIEFEAVIGGQTQRLTQSTNHWVYNRLRVHFHLRRIKDLPQSRFDEALYLVKALQPVAEEFANELIQVRDKFIVKVLGGGEHWTPDTKGKLTRLGQTLPESPDWRALAAQIGKKTY